MNRSVGLWILIAGGLLAVSGGVLIAPRIRRLAWAIANAERGPDEINSGVIARNNPGDLTDVITGRLRTYDSVQEGWNALYQQLDIILAGRSPHYPGGLNMTLNDMAQIWVGTSDWPNWANNVSTYLGVSPDTTLGELV